MTEVARQKHLIHELDDADGSSWLIILDAGRCDVFEDIYDEYFESDDYQRVYNGGWPATPYWFNDMFKYPVDGFLFHGGQKIKRIFEDEVDYDEDECFEHAPNPMLYDSYEGGEGDITFRTPDPASVNEVVEQHLPDGHSVNRRLMNLGYMDHQSETRSEPVNMNVVRYLQPHAPYRSLDHISDHRFDIIDNIKEGTMHRQEWIDAYIDNFHWGMEYASELVDTLIDWGADNIVITSDHGECFGDCGDWFHGSWEPREEEYHIHMVTVPWLRVR